MQLRCIDRDYYTVEISVDPPLVGSWEASFDGGVTWVTGTLLAGGWSWLVAGPDFDAAAVGMDPADTQATIQKPGVTPILRLQENPVVVSPDCVPSIIVQC
jgi:hypothetical protein